MRYIVLCIIVNAKIMHTLLSAIIVQHMFAGLYGVSNEILFSFSLQISTNHGVLTVISSLYSTCTFTSFILSISVLLRVINSATLQQLISIGSNRAVCQFYFKLQNSHSTFSSPSLLAMGNLRSRRMRRSGRASINANNVSVNVAEIISEELRQSHMS